MYNYKLVIEYDGRKFHGWQKQNYTRNTIQEQIESSIKKLLKDPVALIGSGRTDAGVSAFNQVANFKFSKKIDFEKFRYSVNCILPESIFIKKISKVQLEFHSRFSAKKREYIYKLSFEKKSINREYYHKFAYSIDFKKIDEFINFLLVQNNFKSFCKNKYDKYNFSCRLFVFKYNFIKSKKEIIFMICANRYLHSMIRGILGCTLDIGRGNINLKQIEGKIIKGEKILIQYLPAHALFLNKIYY